MLRGSCLCQGVAFEIDGTVLDLLYCHCSMCRKVHGSAFRARGKVKTSEFRWVRGEETVRYYTSSPGQHRGFCSVCGSNLLTRFDDKPGVLGLALGVLDDDPVNRPLCHVFVSNRAPWHEITDSLPQFEQLPTHMGAPAPADFKPLFRTSPVSELIGPMYYRGHGASLVLGLRVASKHCNARGAVHGGMLATLADTALGYAMAFASDPPTGLVTANLALDFAGTAKMGDWLEAHVDIQKQGRRLSFANCYILMGEQRIVRASAVFLVSGQLDTKGETPPAHNPYTAQ